MLCSIISALCLSCSNNICGFKKGKKTHHFPKAAFCWGMFFWVQLEISCGYTAHWILQLAPQYSRTGCHHYLHPHEINTEFYQDRITLNSHLKKSIQEQLADQYIQKKLVLIFYLVVLYKSSNLHLPLWQSLTSAGNSLDGSWMMWQSVALLSASPLCHAQEPHAQHRSRHFCQVISN